MLARPHYHYHSLGAQHPGYLAGPHAATAAALVAAVAVAAAVAAQLLLPMGKYIVFGLQPVLALGPAH